MAQNQSYEVLPGKNGVKRPLAGTGGKEISQCKFRLPQRQPEKQKPLTSKDERDEDVVHSSSIKMFDITACAKSNQRSPVQRQNPKVKELSRELLPSARLPIALAERFARCKSFLAFDVQTHTLCQRRTKGWSKGPFGFQAQVTPAAIEAMRIVQVGYAIGSVLDETPKTCCVIVRPDGLKIEDDAIEKHHITHDSALADGVPLGEALNKLMDALAEVVSNDGKLAAHNIEFVAGIVTKEIDRAKLLDRKSVWVDTVRAGVCTVDPELCHWVRRSTGVPGDYGTPMRMVDLFTLLCAGRRELMAKARYICHCRRGGDGRLDQYRMRRR